jgi:uncharacterized DUF497 family protein
MEYEWDPDKAESNLSKHSIDFSDVVEALDDPHRLEDPDPYEDEERFLTKMRNDRGSCACMDHGWRFCSS